MIREKDNDDDDDVFTLLRLVRMTFVVVAVGNIV